LIIAGDSATTPENKEKGLASLNTAPSSLNPLPSPPTMRVLALIVAALAAVAGVSGEWR
jgi:hypothetical protein